MDRQTVMVITIYPITLSEESILNSYIIIEAVKCFLTEQLKKRLPQLYDNEI